jgi:hypothetical protein
VNDKTGIAITNDPVTGPICAAHQHARTVDNDALVVDVALGSKDLLVESGLRQPTYLVRASELPTMTLTSIAGLKLSSASFASISVKGSSPSLSLQVM